MHRFLTAGHGTAGRPELSDLFQGAGVDRVVDVRRFPGSRRNPEVASEAMAEWLPEVGIAYVWEPRLGGRRRLPKDEPDADDWWRVEAFRAYAAHTRSDEFRQGLGEVLDLAQGVTLLMCSESLWWRCHRRLVADALTLLHDQPVHHLGHDGSQTLHEASEGAVVKDGSLYYPAQA